MKWDRSEVLAKPSVTSCDSRAERFKSIYVEAPETASIYVDPPVISEDIAEALGISEVLAYPSVVNCVSRVDRFTSIVFPEAWI